MIMKKYFTNEFEKSIKMNVSKIVSKIVKSDAACVKGMMANFEVDGIVYRIKFDCGYYHGKMCLLGNIAVQEKNDSRFVDMCVIKLSGVECDFTHKDIFETIYGMIKADMIENNMEADNDVVEPISELKKMIIPVCDYVMLNGANTNWANVMESFMIIEDIYNKNYGFNYFKDRDFVTALGELCKLITIGYERGDNENTIISKVSIISKIRDMVNKWDEKLNLKFPVENTDNLLPPLAFENFREEAKDIITIFDSASSTNIEYQECWDRMQDLVREIADS